MPLVSIITPVHPDADDHLVAAYRSILDQRLPADSEWEWLVHIDGGPVPDWLAAVGDRRVRVSADVRNRGAARTRNLLAARAAGTFLKVLDADDQLTPGALRRDLAVVRAHPEVRWVTCRARDLLDDGTLVDFVDAPPPGLLSMGSVFREWSARDHRLSIHPATLFADRAAVVALGGWTPVATSEDTGLVLALNCREPGFFLDEVGLTYRKWSKQQTRQGHHQSAELTRARHELIERRCGSLLQRHAGASLRR